MKKITFLLAFFLVFFAWNLNAQITSYPYFEDFESGDGGWIVDDPAAGSWELGTPANTIINSADSGTNAWVTNLTGAYTANEDASVVSPVFDFSSLSAPSIEFSIWWNAEFSWDGMVLQSSIDAGTSWQNVGALNDPNNWFNDDAIGANPGGQGIGWTGRASSNNGSNGWVTARHALTGLAGQSNVLLRFAFASDGTLQDEGVAFDSINIFEVSCPEPSGITITAITGTTVDVNWTPGGTETAWEVVVQTAGSGEPTGSGSSTMANNPYAVSGLTPVTDYEVYVRSDCSGEFSSWVGPNVFQTACAVFTPEYNANMSVNVPDACWDESNDGEVADGPSGSGTSDWRAGTTYAFGASNAINLFAGDTDREWLISPFFDLSADGYQLEVNVAVTNWIDGFTDDTMGSDDEVKLLQSVDGGVTWTTLTTWNAANEPVVGGTEYIQDLTGVTGTNVQFAIWASDGVTNDAEDYDFHVGKFRVRTPPTCQEPSNLTIDSFSDVTADISWTPGGSETSWEVVVQPAGTGAPTGPGVVTTNNPYTATGLTSTTDYEVWVLADCGAGGLSSWTGPITFTTFNTPPPPPVGVTCASGSSSFIMTAEFDGLDGWTGNFNGGDGTWEIPNDSGSFGTGPNAAFSGASFMNYEAGTSTATASAVSPAIDLTSAVDGAELSFYMHAFGDDIGTLNVGVSTSLTGPFTNEFAWAGDLQTSGDDPWVPIGINLDAYLGQIIYVEFSHTGIGAFEGDMSIDLVRVETCGSFCIAPSSILVSNIGGTTADINWNANNGETSWEYVIVPAGTGEPTGPGTTVGATTLNASGLNFSTDYEVWLRADCGGGVFSIWTGPVNFTTTAQFDYLVDCTAGPINTNFCYFNDIDDDPSVATFTYTSSNGLPLNLTFNQGQLEDCCDELVVIDSDGTTELFNDNPPDVSGLTFQSTGDTISWYINSDFSVSCENNAFTPFDVTVACATCINPAATYQVVDDCANGNQFLIDVNVTTLGDATTLTISNNIDGTTEDVSAIGVYQIGPFPFLVDVVVTTSNDQDPSCVINSSAIQLLACPPANDNPCNATIAVVNDDETCDLLTPGTIVEATPSGLPDGTCTGDPDDDVWFQFVAENDVQVISIINIVGGTINLDHAVYEGQCDNLVELFCSDDVFSFDEITYVVGNTYYIRVFSGGSNPETSTFDLCIRNAPVNIDCENAETPCISSGETGAYYFPSVIGIEPGPEPNDIACLGSAPNPSWFQFEVGADGPIEYEISQYESFDDMGNPIGDDLDVDFVLWGPFDITTDYCNLIPPLESDCPSCPNNTTNANFYPFGNIVDCSFDVAAIENFTIDNALEGEIYVLLVANWSRDPGFIRISQTNTGGGFFTADVTGEIGYDGGDFIDTDGDTFGDLITICDDLSINPSVTLTAISSAADAYQWYKDGFEIPGATSSTLVVTESNNYQVQLFNEGCGADAITQLVQVNFYNEATANPVDDIITCDDISADGIENFDLSIRTAQVLGTQDPSDFTVTYYASLSDAWQALNPLPLNFTNTIPNLQTIYVRVEDNATVVDGYLQCAAVTDFDLVVGGVLPTANSDTYPECDDDQDGIASFDLPSRDANILGAQSAADFTVSYYTTLADADLGVNAIDTSVLYNSPTATIYVRVESNMTFDCYETNTMELVVNPSPDMSFVLEPLITCDDASADDVEDFNLESQTAIVIGTQNPADFNVTYHLTLAEAQAGTGALTSPYTNISNPQTIFVRVENATATECFATSSFDLIISGPTPTANSDTYSECDDDFDGIATFDLESRDGNILGTQSATDFTVSYYATLADAEAGTGALTSPYNSSTATLFVRVESNIAFDCYSTTTLELIVDPLPNTTFTTNFDYEVCPGATTPIQITATANNYTESEVTINWYYEGGLISGENELTLPVIDAGLYEIEVIFNQTQCFSSTQQMVIELPTCVIPQGISPNGDGSNDVFDLSSYNVSKLEIFNRYGTLVYSKENYTNEWFGQTNDGDELPVGTYFYTMEYDNGKLRTAWVYIQRLN